MVQEYQHQKYNTNSAVSAVSLALKSEEIPISYFSSLPVLPKDGTETSTPKIIIQISAVTAVNLMLNSQKTPISYFSSLPTLSKNGAETLTPKG